MESNKTIDDICWGHRIRKAAEAFNKAVKVYDEACAKAKAKAKADCAKAKVDLDKASADYDKANIAYQAYRNPSK